MPAMRSAALELLGDSGRVARARFEVAAGLLWHGVVFSMWGLMWPVLAAGWVARAVAVSVLDNVAHHGTNGDLGAAARNLQLAPALGAVLLLHGNLHEVHHRHPELPWIDLPLVHEQSGRHFDGRYVAAVLSQFR